MRKSFTHNGKRYYIRANTEEELYEKIARKKLELENEVIQESNILVKDWFEVWLATFKEPYVSTSTYNMYRYAIGVLNKYIGHRQLKTIRSSDIQDLFNKETGSSKSKINKLYLTLKQAFERAEIDGKISKTPVKGIIRPKAIEGNNRALTDEEREVILKVAENHIYGNWILTMLYMGLRPSETALLRGTDVDHEHQELHVRGTKTYHSNRFIPIPTQLYEFFDQFTDDELIFTTSGGKMLNRKDIQRRWKNFKRSLDIEMGATVYRNKIIESVVAEDLVLYSLRHTFGTDCATAGVDALVLAKLMGHSDIRTTNKYYVHNNRDMRESARQKLEEYRKTPTK